MCMYMPICLGSTLFRLDCLEPLTLEAKHSTLATYLFFNLLCSVDFNYRYKVLVLLSIYLLMSYMKFPFEQYIWKREFQRKYFSSIEFIKNCFFLLKIYYWEIFYTFQIETGISLWVWFQHQQIKLLLYGNQMKKLDSGWKL